MGTIRDEIKERYWDSTNEEALRTLTLALGDVHRRVLNYAGSETPAALLDGMMFASEAEEILTMWMTDPETAYRLGGAVNLLRELGEPDFDTDGTTA